MKNYPFLIVDHATRRVIEMNFKFAKTPTLWNVITMTPSSVKDCYELLRGPLADYYRSNNLAFPKKDQRQVVLPVFDDEPKIEEFLDKGYEKVVLQ